MNTDIEKVFNCYPTQFKEKLLLLRQLIIDIAANTEGVDELEETLKWGEPSYVTSQTKSGSTIRIDWKKSQPLQYEIYFNCKTTLIQNFKEIYGDMFKYGGNRSIIFYENDEIPINEISMCITLALTYNKKKNKGHGN